MSNPLLNTQQLPVFDQIKAEHIEPALDQCLSEGNERLETLLKETQEPDWENFIQPLESSDNHISRMWSPVSHMNAVVNTPELRDAYNNCLPKLSQYSTERGQNQAFFKAVKSIQQRQDALGLSDAQKQSLNNAVKGFSRSGVDLPDAKKQRFTKISQQLSELSSKFSDNVLDSTNSWHKKIDNPDALGGLSENALAAAKQLAAARDMDGYLLTLDFPSFHAVMTYADDRELRKTVYKAFTTRASEQFDDPGFDNSELMVEILKLRQEKSALLGFDTYADYSTDVKMAQSPQQVLDFLSELAEKSLPHAKAEFTELQTFAKEQLGLKTLEAWDVGYASEKLKQQQFEFSSEDLKPYFPADKVLDGLFAIVAKLYDIRVRLNTDAKTWHPDVRFYDIVDDSGELVAQFYLDLYARQHKRGGAWMADCCSRFRDASGLQIPVAFMTCNSSPPAGDKPALFTHDEVITLFHEFGHGLHHMLTQIEHLDISGISGVEWDAVELPSQFMENWCWQRESLDMFAKHYKTGENIPDELFAKLKAAQHFQSAMAMVRQLEFALFDMRIHLDKHISNASEIQAILDQTRQEVAVVPATDFNRFQHGFSHIFAGGYAAGYYSYKWAEVLSSDAFARFEEDGLFSREAGGAFLKEVLQQGGARPAMESFVAFRGREPTVDALLRHSGLTQADAA